MRWGFRSLVSIQKLPSGRNILPQKKTRMATPIAILVFYTYCPADYCQSTHSIRTGPINPEVCNGDSGV